jgi:hypothetical protein
LCRFEFDVVFLKVAQILVYIQPRQKIITKNSLCASKRPVLCFHLQRILSMDLTRSRALKVLFPRPYTQCTRQLQTRGESVGTQSFLSFIRDKITPEIQTLKEFLSDGKVMRPTNNKSERRPVLRMEIEKKTASTALQKP